MKLKTNQRLNYLIIRLFRKLDTDDDNFISFKEFQNGVKNILKIH